MNNPNKSLRLVTFATVAVVLTTSNSALACWGKKKKTSSAQSTTVAASDRKPRPNTGEKVALVSGMPDFLVWKADGTPKGVVLCLHELGLHSGVYEDLAKRLSSKGYTVYSMDLRGFGGWRDKGKEGKMSLPHTLQDIKAAAEAIKKTHSNAQVFLIGEAMGGALALEAASKWPDLIAGTVSSAPGGEHFNTTHNYVTIGTKSLFSANKDANMAEDLIDIATPKASLQTAFKSDSQVRLDLTPKELMSCQFYMYKARRFARQIKALPVLIVQGLKDGESKPVGSQRVFDALATKNKEYIPVKEGDHYVLEDVKVDDDVVNTTVSWLDKNSGKAY